jgi:GNAT superfamily N-acetyltransferase
MGRGIGRHLVAACLANGAEWGYRRAVAEATNPTSQHILATEGFVMRAQSSYADYRFEDVPVFASVAEFGGPIAMCRDMGPAAPPLAVPGQPT